MTNGFNFKVKTLRLDEDYVPASNTRVTTNFANLARGESRQENLRCALRMIDNRFNALAKWDNPTGDRYAVELDIVTVDMEISGNGLAFPIIEILKTTVVDKLTGARTNGILGNNFSSYVRDYDFSVVLPEYNKGRADYAIPEGYGELHGNLFKSFLASAAYQSLNDKAPVICLSVSTKSTYTRTTNEHPILGVEYTADGPSLTDYYFDQMGLRARYFLPPNASAPLALYFKGDLLNDYTNLELISTIATMETFQKIYRPEIYNANSVAGAEYKADLEYPDYSLTRVVYDRAERSQLAVQQGKFAEETFIKPYKALLDGWSARYAA